MALYTYAIIVVGIILLVAGCVGLVTLHKRKWQDGKWYEKIVYWLAVASVALGGLLAGIGLIVVLITVWHGRKKSPKPQYKKNVD